METLEQNIKPQIPIPNSTAILVLGILSIPCCCCFMGVLGLVLAIIALALYGKAHALYQSNPDDYTEKSNGNLKAGRICAIIGAILSSIYILFAIWLVSEVGWDTLNDPDKMKEWVESLQR
jgi:hypothetical protein